MELLATSVKNKGDIKGIQVGDGEYKFLLYAGDALIFLPQPEKSVPTPFILINNFSNLFGYKINWIKSEFIGLNTYTTKDTFSKWLSNTSHVGIKISKNLNFVVYLPKLSEGS